MVLPASDRAALTPVPAPRAGAAPALTSRGVAWALSAAILLSWPMLAVTAPLGYFDTLAYLSTGERTMALAAELAGLGPEPAAGRPDAAAEAGEVRQIRSFVYSAYLYLTQLTPLGLILTTVLQTAATLMLVLAFVERVGRPRAGEGAAILLVGAATTLPWFASYAMPDILTAAILLYYALLVGRIDALRPGWQAAALLFACFAVASHYGHIPLAAALCVIVMGMSWLAGLPLARTAVFGVVPVLTAVALNLGGSSVALNEASVMPKRLPILLARSIDDGPALWYLREACPEAGYTICEVLPDIPADITTFLWSEDGISRASIAEMDRIRDEEMTILWRTFLAYPGAQTAALLGNFATQLLAVGTDQVHPMVRTTDGFATSDRMAPDYPALALFDPVVKLGTLGGLAALAALGLAGRLTGADRRVVAVICLGILANAMIFGGLSAPVDRYQSRIIWILPALAVLFLWNSARRKTAEPTA